MILRILSAEDVRRAVPMTEAIEAVKSGFAQLSLGKVKMPLRTPIEVSPHKGVTLFMPGYLTGDNQMAIKIVSIFNDNAARGLPLIHALVVVVDPTTGQPQAVMDGTYLTALRTGAASGAATELLANPEARVVAILGAGAQGKTQLEAVCAVRPIEQVWVYDTNPKQSAHYAREMSERLSRTIEVAGSPDEALAQADIICTSTTSSTPVFSDGLLKQGVHINAIGAYTPQMQEIPAETVVRAKVVIDHRTASLAEAGDLLIPLHQGLIKEDHIHAELGEIIAGSKPGRGSRTEITLFKSVGVAAQDIAVASRVLANAERMGLGVNVTL